MIEFFFSKKENEIKENTYITNTEYEDNKNRTEIKLNLVSDMECMCIKIVYHVLCSKEIV